MDKENKNKLSRDELIQGITIIYILNLVILINILFYIIFYI